jgi:hypothetical protein
MDLYQRIHKTMMIPNHITKIKINKDMKINRKKLKREFNKKIEWSN